MVKHFSTLLRMATITIATVLVCSCSQQMQSPTPPEDVVTEDPYFVSEADAHQVAESFIQSTGLRALTDSRISLLLDDLSLTEKKETDQQPAYYVYELDKGGFVIVSATRLASPVLGFSLQNNFSKDNRNMRSFLSVLSDQIREARVALTADDPEKDDPRYKKGEEVPGMGHVVVPMMLRTRWNQDEFTGGLLPRGYAIGCLALATGQVMKFWSYPSEAMGSYSYTDKNLGPIRHDYNYKIHWDAMPNINSERNPMLEKFFYGLAISMNMNFGPESGAVMTDVPSALARHYGYPKDMYVQQRGNTRAAEWIVGVKGEIDKGRPVLYGGQGDGGGHAFVLDGYTDQDFFHVNWGWGGISDGWFLIDALNPDALGTGGGTGGGFSKYQHMMMNFQPPLTATGDDTDPVPGDEEEEVEEIVYSPAYGLSQLYAFLSFTRFNGRETSSGPESYTSFPDRIIPADRSKGITYLINPTFTADVKPAWISIWMDIDNDGYFADYEILAQHEKVSGPVEGVIQIPEIISDGSHRIRVYLSLDGAPSAQKNTLNGEVEDYVVVIK